MSERYGDIRSLETVITTEARQDASKIEAEAQSHIESIKRQALEQANRQRDAILKQARDRAETMRSQAVTSAQLEAQALKLERRETLLARVMSEARQGLTGVTEWPDYVQVLCRLIREGAEVLGAESLVIRADETTRRMLDEADERHPTVLTDLREDLAAQLELGEPLERGTGVVLVTADGHRRYDNTLETRLSRMQAALRTPVYRILMGETP
jgi:vacuolar-type H+-ATPase subunit E/Vma4